MKQALVRAGDQHVVVPDVTIAAKGSARIKGLLGTDQLPADEGLLIARTKQIHTFGMRYPLDVAFLSRDLVVVRVLRDVVPNRMTRVVWSSAWVLETAAGATDLTVGDRLQLVQLKDL